MDALRIERLCWSLPLGGFLAVLVAGLVVPDPTGTLWVAGALSACLVTVPFSFWFLARFESPDATAGDLTVQWTALFTVVVSLNALLNAVGVGGFANNLVSFGGGYAAASRARRWNPLRRRGGASA
ncbi:hypothetical protein SAMN04488063_0526 [Halopelagius inordinatus]|uniref:Uncharacterized protein n=1 Tax=Halopelagius inordinatus TaxID=553467 RepID=A0A1I2M753_9EURY|nr:hypothetical protein [Halopelagius inordinatus]SFF85256.1 hypothetical protein SAMN04488063_0526 [Halopelagius inordinatus]